MESRKYNYIYIAAILIFLLVVLPVFEVYQVGQLALVSPGGTTGNVDILLTVAVIFRVIVMAGLGIFLWSKWIRSDKRFISDLTFLMGLTCLILVAGKLYDLYLYNYFGTTNLVTEDPGEILLAKFRWILMVANITPLVSILSKIWLEGYAKERVSIFQYVIPGGIAGAFIIAIMLITEFDQLQIMTPLIVFPMALLSFITFAFLYKNKRLPSVHSLIACIGWLAYLISSFVRPVLTGMGEPPWGLAWVAEIIDMIVWGIIAIAFIIKPNYS